MLAERRHGLVQSPPSSLTWKTPQTLHGTLWLFKCLAHPKPDQITIDFTIIIESCSKRSHDMSIHVLWRLSTWSLEIPVTSSSVSPPPFSVLDKQCHRRANTTAAFRTWTSSCKRRKWWSRLTNCQLKNKNALPIIACHSCHVNPFHLFVTWRNLSFCYTLLIITIRPSLKNIHRSTLYQCRPSICRADSMDHRRQEPLSPSSTNMTLKPDPWTNPQVKHKQTSFDICLQQGNGEWKACFSDQIIFKSILPKMRCWNQPPGKAGPQKNLMRKILEDCNYSHDSENWDIDTNSIAAQGTISKTKCRFL